MNKHETHNGWYVVCRDSYSDGDEGVYPVFYREVSAAKRCLCDWVDRDKRDLFDNSPDIYEIAEDGMSAVLENVDYRRILYRIGKIVFED